MIIVTIVTGTIKSAVFDHMRKCEGLSVVDTYSWYDGDKYGITSVIKTIQQ